MSKLSNSLSLLFVLSSMGCSSPEALESPPSAEGTSGGESSDRNQQVFTVAPTHCETIQGSEGVNRIVAEPFDWVFLIGGEPEVDCEERRVDISMGAGFKVVLVAMDPSRSEATAELMGRLMVDVMIEALTGSAPPERAAMVTVGEKGRRGVCRELEHDVEGVALITVACSVWEAEPSGLEHVAFATITDLDSEWAHIEGGPVGLAGRALDLWVVHPETRRAPER